MNALTRRQMLGLGLGVGAAALAGCAPPGATSPNAAAAIPPIKPGETITLTYWAWLKDLQKVADIWNAKNPSVQVEAVWIPGGNSGGYQKMYSALAAGGGPDIAQVELRSVPEFMLVNGLVDLSRYGIKDHASAYDEAIWNQVVYNDGVYGVPQDSGPMAFYYQTAALQKVGAEPPKTWDDWAEIAAEIRKENPSNYLEVFPVSDGSAFVSYATQAGAQWFTAADDHWEINMTDDATLRVARFFDQAIDKDLVNTAFTAFSPGWTAAAGAGRIAATTNASWGDALIQSVGGGEGKWKVAPMQTWGADGFGSSYLGGSTAAVLANSLHPKEALDFCLWMTTSQEGIDAMINNSGIGWSPTSDYIGKTRRQPSKWFSGQNYNEEVFVPAAKAQNPDWSWWPITQRTMNLLADGFRKKLTEGQSLVDTMAKTQAETIATFKHVGLDAREVS